MTIAWIIGLILCLIALVLMKYSVEIKTEYHYPKDIKSEVPILRVWMIIVGIIVSIIPIVNLLMGLVFLINLLVGYGTKDIKCRLAETKLGKFLNKPVT